MRTTSASRANDSMAADASAPKAKNVLIWDAPVRVFHWLMVLCFAGAYITAESETWRLVHVTLGYTMAGLVAFRLVWGLAGTPYARFASFVRGPKAVMAYVRSMLSGQPEHHIGHNPAGALAIVAMLALTVGIGATGWATYNDIAGEWVAKVHELAANTMLLVVGVHIAGVVIASLLHKENLLRSMVTGRKLATPAQGIRSAWRTVAALMLVAVLGFWYVQWQSAPAQNTVLGNALPQLQAGDGDHDGD
jgi:cytochrome b